MTNSEAQCTRGSAEYSGERGTFMKCPYVEDVNLVGDAEVAIFGAPLDAGTTYRPGTRFGPMAIRQTDYLPHDGSRPSLALRTDGLRDLHEPLVALAQAYATLERWDDAIRSESVGFDIIVNEMRPGRQRRARPMDMGPAAGANPTLGAPLVESTWIEPVPDASVLDDASDPSTGVSAALKLVNDPYDSSVNGCALLAERLALGAKLLGDLLEPGVTHPKANVASDPGINAVQ